MASIPESALHDTPLVRQQHGQYTAAKLGWKVISVPVISIVIEVQSRN